MASRRQCALVELPLVVVLTWFLLTVVASSFRLVSQTQANSGLSERITGASFANLTVSLVQALVLADGSSTAGGARHQRSIKAIAKAASRRSRSNQSAASNRTQSNRSKKVKSKKLTRADYDKLLISAAEWVYKNAYSKDYMYETKGKKLIVPTSYNGIEIDENLSERWKIGLKPVCKPGKNKVVRPNHALDNAIRKAMIMPYVVKAYERHHQYKSIFQEGKKDQYLFMMQIGAMFEVSGRQSELGFNENANIFYTFRNRSFAYMRALMKDNPDIKKAVGIPVDPKCGSTTIFDRIVDGVSRMYKSSTADRTNVHFKTIFEMTHDLELARCFGSDNSKPKMDAKFEEVKGELGSHTKALFDLTVSLLWEMGAQIQWAPEGSDAKRRYMYDCKTFGKYANDAKKAFEVVKKKLPKMDTFFEGKAAGTKTPTNFAPCAKMLGGKGGKGARGSGTRKGSRKRRGERRRRGRERRARRGKK